MRAGVFAVALAGCWSTTVTSSSPTRAPNEPTTSTPTVPPSTTVPPPAGPLPPSPIPVIMVKEPTVGPSPDREIVRRYVHRNRKQIRLCYEAALAKFPDLTGKVVVDFTIGGDGKVTATRASGLNADVEACVATVIAAIEFPAPTGKMPLRISYPFVFQTTADDN